VKEQFLHYKLILYRMSKNCISHAGKVVLAFKSRSLITLISLSGESRMSNISGSKTTNGAAPEPTF
jgi:hypothetical protein